MIIGEEMAGDRPRTAYGHDLIDRSSAAVDRNLAAASKLITNEP